MIIYKATNKINGKLYIGQTIYSLEYRKSQHERNYRYRKDMAISNAIKKYGKDNFEWEVIDTAETIDELNKKESFWINKLDTIITHKKGYNIKGGGYNAFLTDETKRKIGNAQKGELNHQFGKKGEDCKHSKPVRNITDNIDYVSIKECSDLEEVPYKVISAICNGNKGSYHGKQYRFIDKKGNIIIPEHQTEPKVINRVTNLTTNITYPSIADASLEYGDNCGNLAREIRRNNGYCLWKNCKWKLENIDIEIDDIPNKNYRSDAMKVINLDTNDLYNSIKDADKYGNLNKLLKKGNGSCIWKKQRWKVIND